MERIPNPELERIILDHLAKLYNIKEKREGIHLSTLVYCLTRSFFDQKSPIEPTDQEVLLFALGYGLQDVITPQEAEAPVLEYNGITYRPDMVLKVGAQELGEIKTTRASLKNLMANLPETWVEYIMGGCYIRGQTSYNLIMLPMMGNYSPPFPEIKAETLVFTQDELDSNWEYILARREVYLDALGKNQPPEPYLHCKDWECKYCRYKMMCEVITKQNCSIRNLR